MPIPPRRPGTLGGGAGCPGIPFEGWCWKGGVLSLHALATYRAGLEFKHLGRALAQTGSARDFPVLFRIYAHAAQRPSPRSQTVAFPEDAHFWVREVRWLPDGRVCLGLEQAPRGEELLEDFDRPFEAWLATLHGQLPAPSARMRQLAQLPFARWATGAVPGDPPISGILYDFEEAIRFAAGFTDQSPILVEKVLAARERYLEMADKFHLLITGGSDCHGFSKGKPLIGTVKLPYEHVEKLKAKVEARRLSTTDGHR